MPVSAHILPGANYYVDRFGNKWQLDPTGHPIINDTIHDQYSGCKYLELWGDTTWQEAFNGQWWSITPTGKITDAAQLPPLWKGALPSPWPAPPPAPTPAPTPVPVSSGAPPQAVAAGFTERTYGPKLRMGTDWFPWTGSMSGSGLTVNVDGSIGIRGGDGNHWNAQLVSTRDKKADGSGSGVAFGGGGYFEALFKYDNPSGGWYQGADGWPAWWGGAWEAAFAGGLTPLTNIECDFLEAMTKGSPNFNHGLINWNTGQMLGAGQIGIDSTCVVPAGTRSDQPHRYGWLWMPASATSQGYAQAYFDGVAVGPRYTWDLWSATDPLAQQGSKFFGSIDRQHLQLILGTGSANPMTVYEVSVWQRPGGNKNWGSVPVQQPASAPGPPGPAAASAFLAADFLVPKPDGSGAQQVVSRRLYGVSTGGAGNNGFAALANPTYQSIAGKVNPGLWWFKNSGQKYWRPDLTIDPAALANLVNNFPKLDPLGIAGVAMIIDWSMVPGGEGNPAVFAKAMAALVQYLANATMPNGRRFPLVLVQGQDEPNGKYDEATTVSYYAALIPAVKAVAPGVLISGPSCDYVGWLDFGSKAPIDVFSFNYFRGGQAKGDQLGAEVLTANNWAPIQDAANAALGNLQATLVGGCGLDWNCCVPANNTHIGALYHAVGWLTSLDRARRAVWSCIWDAFGDGTCGIITDPGQQGGYFGVTSTMQITPKGYLLAEAVRRAYGKRWQLSTNAAGLLAAALTPSDGHCTLLVANAGKGAQMGKTVALSHWPVNGTGNGLARVWQMGAAATGPGIDGSVRYATVTAGMLTCDFPDPSVTIISV